MYRRLRERGYEVFAVNPNAHVEEKGSAFIGGSPQVPSHPHLTPIIAHNVHKRPADSFSYP